MDAAESPLEVLSRAATMVQSYALPTSFEVVEGGGKWRRSGRSRRPPPQYQADPDRNQQVHSTTKNTGEPIDLSTRRMRGLPPSYSETIAKQHNSVSSNKVDKYGVSSTTDGVQGALCDPMIDEHFRRSLGQGYLSSEDDSNQPDTTLHPPTTTSLSVDDHFAKSLGERWLELQREEEEARAVKSIESSSQRLVSDVQV